MKAPADGRAPLAALLLIVATTAAWWALALWPAGDAAPAWLVRTRDVCFGVQGDALPDAGGWVLLIGQPLGMIAVLLAVWGRDVRGGVTRLLRSAGGQLLAGGVLALCLIGILLVAKRVRGGEELLAAGFTPTPALTRIDDAAPALALTDQSGRTVSLDAFRGRPVLVTFAYAHCQTVCPLVVSDVLTARARFDRDPPAVLIVTLDPWRDTPDRLPSIARLWALNGEAHVLSGPPDAVERTLSTWRVPRTRNLKTGDVTHPAMVYVVGADGRIAYALTGDADAIAAAVRTL